MLPGLSKNGAPVQKGSQRGIFFKLQVYETKGVGGILQVEVYEQVGKTVISLF